jgi:antitoxin component of MazEF toxin-antitoxin module
MEDYISLEGPVELLNGNLALRIPLDAGGDILTPLAKGIGEADDEYLNIIIPHWLAEDLRISEGSLIFIDNKNGKLNITRSSANDIISLKGPVELLNGRLSLRIPLSAGGDKFIPFAKGIGETDNEYLNIIIPPQLAGHLGITKGSLVIVDNKNNKLNITRSSEDMGAEINE